MSLLNCPKSEFLFEYVSIPQEISFFRKVPLKLHTLTCHSCQEKMQNLRKTWQAYFTPEPDITSSVMKVYSRLQNDETLILKGWKLSEARQRKSLAETALRQGWLFRGAVSFGVFAVLGLVILTHWQSPRMEVASNTLMNQRMPLAQIRSENKNSVRVQYLQPELLQSIEFETRGSR